MNTQKETIIKVEISLIDEVIGRSKKVTYNITWDGVGYLRRFALEKALVKYKRQFAPTDWDIEGLRIRGFCENGRWTTN